jgi:hypothetical protein
MFTYQWPATSVVASHCTLPGVWGKTGIEFPPRLACALTVKRTVAVQFPAGCTDVMRSDDTVMVGPPLPTSDCTHDRWAGSTVAVTAAALLLPRAAQNAVTACSAAVAWSGVSVPDAAGGLVPAAAPAAAAPGSSDSSVKTCDAGGAETRTGTPKS